jgi:uncharacterized protein (TIGR00255 family)
MTGFGRGTAEAQGREATVEIKAVNSRYLDISFHMPRVLNLMEERVRRAVSTAIGRGKVDVFVAYRNRREDHAQVLVDTALAKSYRKAMDELREQTGLDNDLSLTSLASYPMVLTVMEAEEDEDALWAVVEKALNFAIAMLLDMRLREGERLREDLLGKTKGLRGAIEVIKEAAPAMEQNVRERLMQKMQEFIDADETIRQRVLAEAALLCDKRAVDEEIVRFLSHLDEFEHNLMQTDAVGRKLDFIVQEMNREINTIGSKASEAEVNASVIAIKSEMEKIREQIQNIE